MKIVKRYKGYSIRKSKFGWFSVYSNTCSQNSTPIDSVKSAREFINNLKNK